MREDRATREPARAGYLRLSVTGRCGLRCPYCQPEGPQSLASVPSMLAPEEIRRVVSALARMGTSHVRLTGGEPLARRDCGQIVESIAHVPGIVDIAMTTNGQGFADRVREFAAAGLTRINIHIDSLRPDRYRALARRGSLAAALRSVEAACRENLRPVKINMVLMKGINDDELPAFCRLACEWGVTVRFIELMNTGPASAFVRQHFMSAAEAREQLARSHSLALRFEDRGASPAREYNVDHGAGTIGFIASETEPFCLACNRVRVTAEGRLKVCLYEADGLDLRALVRDPAVGDRQLADQIAAALDGKRSHHPAFGQAGEAPFAMAQIGG